MSPVRTEDLDGTLVTQTPDRLTLRSSFRSNGLGALSWCLLIWFPSFVVRMGLIAAHVRVAPSLDALLSLDGLVVWIVAFICLVSQPPLIVRRDGRIYRGSREVAFLQSSGIVVVPRKSLFCLGYGPNPEQRQIEKALFVNADAARRVGDRINAFLGLSPFVPPKL